MLENNFLKACDWLYNQRWVITADGNRGYYLNRDIGKIEIAYCSSKADIIKFVENASIGSIFTERNNLYAGDLLDGKGEKQAASESKTEEKT